jgi:addiction module RelE/StbE family toxin
MTVKVVWLEQAFADLQAVRAYVSAHNPAAARKVASRIRKTVPHLTAHPHLGRPTDVQDIREMTVAGLPDLLAYRVREDRIEILRVFHTSQQRPESWEES